MSIAQATPEKPHTTAQPIVCDEIGSLNPVAWQGTTKSLGDDYAAVLRLHDNRFLNVREHRGRIEILGRDRVGVLRLPSGRRVLIRTKLPGVVLVDWLAYLGEFPDIQHWDQNGNILQDDSYQSVLTSIFLHELDIVTRRHLRMDFVKSVVESPDIRGRILSHHLAQRLWRLPAIPQAVRGRNINTPQNQMLAAALDRVLIFSFDLQPESHAMLRQLRHSWSGILRSTHDLEQIIHSSMSATPTAGYRSALQLARLILTGATFDPTPGSGGDTFTISLARMWENSVSKICRELSATTGWQVAPRSETIRCWDDADRPEGPRRSMIVDTMLYRGEQRWILDAKYKRDFGNESRSDRFQMCGYVLGFGASRATLVYPTESEAITPHRGLLSTSFGNKSVTIDTIALPMIEGPKRCRKRLFEFFAKSDALKCAKQTPTNTP